MRLLLLILVSFSASVSLARLSDGKVQFKVFKDILIGDVAPGFHFNKDGPAGLTVMGTQKEIVPVKKEEKALAFELKGVGAKPFNVSFYVCDDKKTVCEEHVVAMSVKNGQVELLGMGVPAGKKEEKKAPTVGASLQHNAHGFIENNLEAALSEASKKKQLVLVDYGAPWCPACVRFETEVFGTAEFSKLTQKVVKLYLNADDQANKEFAKKYNIKALPTLLVLNAKGDEIYRSLDFKPVDVLAKDLKPHLQVKEVNWAKLESQALRGEKKAQRALAERAFAMLDYEGIVKWYGLLRDTSSKYAYGETSMWAERFEADKGLNEKPYAEVLNKWIQTLPESYHALSTRNDLAAIYKDQNKPLPETVQVELQKNVELANKVLQTPAFAQKFWAEAAGDYAPFRNEEVMAQQASSFDYLGKKEEKAKVLADLKSALEKKELTVQRPGEVLMALAYFQKVDMNAKAEEWLLTLDKTSPENYAYAMKLARFYQRQKNFDKALPFAERAVEKGTELRLSNLQLLAEIQKSLKLKSAAIKSIDQALALPEAKLERNQKTTVALQELKKAL